jgi:peptidoglycan/LPS O-acetylase OafA/YrhL
VLVPALLAGIAVDAVGLSWYNSSELYTNSMQYQTDSLGIAISSSMDLATFFGNLFLLQGILTGNLGSNGPLWSLSYEWWYYCIFALLGAAMTSAWRFRFIYLLGALALALWLPEKLVIWGLIWLLGVAAHAWIVSGLRRPSPIVGIAVFAIALVLSRISHSVDSAGSPESIVRDFGLGIGYVFALAGVSRMSGNIPFPKLHQWLANFSYSTYLFHFPMLIFSVAFGYQVFGFGFRLQPDSLGLLYLCGVTVVIYCYCYFWFLVAERHTNTVRSYLLNWTPKLRQVFKWDTVQRNR